MGLRNNKKGFIKYLIQEYKDTYEKFYKDYAFIPESFQNKEYNFKNYFTDRDVMTLIGLFLEDLPLFEDDDWERYLGGSERIGSDVSIGLWDPLASTSDYEDEGNEEDFEFEEKVFEGLHNILKIELYPLFHKTIKSQYPPFDSPHKPKEELLRLEAERKAAEEELLRVEAERKAAEEEARLEAERKANFTVTGYYETFAERKDREHLEEALEQRERNAFYTHGKWWVTDKELAEIIEQMKNFFSDLDITWEELIK